MNSKFPIIGGLICDDASVTAGVLCDTLKIALYNMKYHLS
jgi:hypothetical protein